LIVLIIKERARKRVETETTSFARGNGQ
jgi:hypothetical protein